MDIISKKDKPIKSYRKYSKIIIILLYIVGIIVFYQVIIAKIYGFLLIFGPVFFWICWNFNSEFEIYNDRFAVGYNFIFLPCKLIITEIFFDNINWIDGGEEFRGRLVKLIMRFYFKNGEIKECVFNGDEKDFYDVIYNWKKIAKYERK